MGDGGKFLDAGAVPTNGNPQSDAAALSMVPHRMTLVRKVYDLIASMGPGGMTCDEVERVTGLRHQTASARIFDLRERGLIADSSRKALTRSGRKATVWIVFRAWRPEDG